jgi:hypothetical protein
MITLDGALHGPGGREEDRAGGFKYGGCTSSNGDELFGEIMNEEMLSKYAH